MKTYTINLPDDMGEAVAEFAFVQGVSDQQFLAQIASWSLLSDVDFEHRKDEVRMLNAPTSSTPRQGTVTASQAAL